MDSAAVSIKEQNFLITFPDWENEVYCSLYLPQIDPETTGVVIVPPLGQERHWIFRETVNLARDLSQAGFPVIRFDYRGEGESSGEFQDSSISSRLEDIAFAVKELRKITAVKNICLLGFKLGATLALVSAKELNCKKVLACDPVVDTKLYAETLIKFNISMQLYYFGKVLNNNRSLRETLKSGGTVSAYGFPITKELIEEIEQLDVRSKLSEVEFRSGLVYFSLNETAPKNDLIQLHGLLNKTGLSQLLAVKEDFSGTGKRRWRPHIKSLNHVTIDWLKNES